MTAYYNEFDPFAAQWLRNLIAENLIAPGEVDERSIEDVAPDDLVGFTQCHFFAGIGGWSLALRQAGWADDRPAWTGSCPCQPFSAAGKGAGFDDERHLWPAFHWLIQQRRPSIVFGEQVSSKTAEPWFDLVQTDLEALGYAFGCVAFPAAGIGAPHMRDRSYWMGYSQSERLEGRLSGRQDSQREGIDRHAGCDGAVGGLADTPGKGPLPSTQRGIHCGEESAGPRHGEPERQGSPCGLADAQSGGCGERGREAQQGSVRHADGSNDATGRLVHPEDIRNQERHPGAMGGPERALQSETRQGDGEADRTTSANGRLEHPDTERCGEAGEAGTGQRPAGAGSDSRPGPVNGEWRSADWLYCRDGKWRPVEPGTFPLVDGLPNRVGLLRGYGNAIVPAQAAEFVLAARDYIAQEKAIEIVVGLNS